jgi:hypothetical protein
MGVLSAAMPHLFQVISPGAMVDVVVELMAALTSDRWVKAFGSCPGAAVPYARTSVAVTSR